MVTSSGCLLLLLGRSGVGAMAANVLSAPGEFSLRNEDGSLERGGSLEGEPNDLPLPPLDDGVDGIGEFGNDLSSSCLWVSGGRRGEGDIHDWAFWLPSG